MAYAQGVVSVGTSPTKICTPDQEGALVQNLGTSVVYLGGPTVTADASATGGVTLPANMTSPVPIAVGLRPGTLDADDGLYGCVAAGSVNVAFLTGK
jgi:hypothetical protein